MAFVLVLQLRQDRARRQPGQAGRRARVPRLPQPRRRPLHRRRAARSRGSTSSTTPRRTRSPPAATRSTRRSPSPPGCSRSMNRVELEGVLAHELSHVKNYDILVIDRRGHRGRRDRAALRPRPAVHVVCGGAREPRRQQRRRRRSASIIAIAAMALLILAPFAAQLMQFAMSRKRELLADAQRRAAHPLPARADLGAREAAGRPGRRAPRHPGHRPDVDRVAARTDEQGGTKGSKLNRLFDTHPPLEERIAVLEAM